MHFSGVLQSAPSLDGPWIDLTNAVSPHEIPVGGGGTGWYRAREEAGSGIFDARSVVDIVVIGPLQAHFELAFAGMPDGIFPPVREKPYFDARIEVFGGVIPVSMRVRGNSSLQECPFPKLKFKVSRGDRENSPFADAREVKIITHCGEGGRGPIGRLRDETATWREAMVFEAMEAVGLTGPRVRRARIEYRDESPPAEERPTGWRITRMAVLLDHVEVVAERLGGRALSDEEVARLENAGFDEETVALLHLFQALVGNWDYELSVDGVGLWNIEVIEGSDRELVPVASDFDLAGWVTGVTRPIAPPDYRPDLEELVREALYALEEARATLSPLGFASARARFLERRPAIETAVHAAQVDAPGRTNALRHVTAFYDALGRVP